MQDYVFVQSISDVFQQTRAAAAAARAREAINSAANGQRDNDSIPSSPFAWQVRTIYLEMKQTWHQGGAIK